MCSGSVPAQRLVGRKLGGQILPGQKSRHINGVAEKVIVYPDHLALYLRKALLHQSQQWRMKPSQRGRWQW